MSVKSSKVGGSKAKAPEDSILNNAMAFSLNNLGVRIRKLRKDANETQSELGEAVGVVQQSVAAWESGRCAPSLPNLCDLAKHYKVTADYLLSISDLAYGYRGGTTILPKYPPEIPTCTD